MTSVLSPISTDVQHPQVPALPEQAHEALCPGWCRQNHDQGEGVVYEAKTDTWELLHCSPPFGDYVRLYAGTTVDAAGNSIEEEPARIEVSGHPDWMDMDTATELGSHIGAALLEVRDNVGAEPGTKFGDSGLIEFLSLVEGLSNDKVDRLLALLREACKAMDRGGF